MSCSSISKTAVAPDDKVQARKNVIEAINDIDWGSKSLSVRINGLDTHYMYRDVVDVVEQAGGKLDLIMIPKVGTAADVYAVDMMVTQIEAAKGFKNRIGFELIIETALGMQNIEAIGRRLEAHRIAAFSASPTTPPRPRRARPISAAPTPDYAVLTDPDAAGHRMTHWGDMWHYAIARMVVAARANGIRPIDGPFGDFSDTEGYRAAARRAAVLGCEGKWAIHPVASGAGQRDVHAVRSGSDQAKRILVAMEEAQREGRGAVALDGKLIDLASIRQAEVLVKKAAQIAGA
ncbi:MAG: CoA ester lyase [Aliidongia sp.]